MPFITDPPPPPEPPPDEYSALRTFAATVRIMYGRGGHITRAEVQAALEALDAATKG